MLSGIITASAQRGTRRLLLLPLVLVTSFGCGKAALDPLVVVGWSAADGAPIPLEQTLRIEFSAALSPQLRSGAVWLTDTNGIVVGDYQLEVAGSFLSLIPRLPTRVDLSDAGFPPSRELRLHLRGLPALGAISSSHGEVLVGDQVLAFRTLSAQHPDALLGGAGGERYLRLIIPGGGIGNHVVIPPHGTLMVQCSGPIDPRSLREPAQLRTIGAQQPRLIPLTLASNSVQDTVLVGEIGQLEGWAVLEMPTALCGLGGAPLLDSHRQLRLTLSGDSESGFELLR